MRTFKFTLVVTLFFFAAMPAEAQESSRRKELLSVSDKAPALDIEHWLTTGKNQLGPVTQFEEGKIYVIAFWRANSNASIQSLLLLNQIQQRYAKDGVCVIAVSDDELDVVEKLLDADIPNQQNKPLKLRQIVEAYSLASDPDLTTYADYMQAAGQYMLPTAFIIGKKGSIEWLGPVTEMQRPLGEVVIGIWDQKAARLTSLPAQRKSAVLSKVNEAMKAGDTDKALEVIDKAIQEFSGDNSFANQLASIRIRVQVTPATKMSTEGKHDEALDYLDKLLVEVPEHRVEISQIRFGILLQAERFDDAATALDEFSSKVADPIALNQIAWTIYEASKDQDAFSEKLLDSASAMAKKAVELAPTQAAIYDTYAHLLHRSGNLDGAIEVQTKAVGLVNEQQNPGIKPFLEQLKKEKEEAIESSE